MIRESRTVSRGYRLSPVDLENIRRIREAEPHIRSDTEAIRLALAEAARRRKGK